MFDFSDHIEPCEQLAIQQVIAVFNGIDDRAIDDTVNAQQAPVSFFQRFFFKG